MLMNDQAAEFSKKRERFMKPFEGNVILKETIPAIAQQLMYDQFHIQIHIKEAAPIAFTEGWRAVAAFLENQNYPEFAVDVCGVSLQYDTDYSESEKPTNINPKLRHLRRPSFKKEEHQAVPGSEYQDNLLQKYNSWRSVNLEETIDKLERDVYAIMVKEFGIELMVNATILPLMAATYIAGLTIAEETHQPVNMYNVFEIDIVDGQIVLSPFSVLKQKVKGDSKK